MTENFHNGLNEAQGDTKIGMGMVSIIVGFTG